ncbi:MAG: hypothetical protein MJZ20_02870 [Bacteroidaceae bacterium]|nr:hypothetical protein [Bacteroidaceae bacterium]
MFDTQIQREKQVKGHARMGKYVTQTETSDKKKPVYKKRIEKISDYLLAWTVIAEQQNDWKLQKTAVLRAILDLDNV